jgi:diadenosine tetraphosphate (Ap4A) HIT family hydrolase
VREVRDLNEGDQQLYLKESNITCAVLQNEFAAEKLNVAALGNMVPQLHIHHIARFTTDVAWPKPVWGLHPAQPYAADALNERVSQLRAAYAKSALALVVA